MGRQRLGLSSAALARIFAHNCETPHRWFSFFVNQRIHQQDQAETWLELCRKEPAGQTEIPRLLFVLAGRRRALRGPFTLRHDGDAPVIPWRTFELPLFNHLHTLP
jgi:hypothetical protein